MPRDVRAREKVRLYNNLVDEYVHAQTVSLHCAKCCEGITRPCASDRHSASVSKSGLIATIARIIFLRYVLSMLFELGWQNIKSPAEQNKLQQSTGAK